MPSSVLTLRNELTRQPASQCRSSTLTIFIGLPSQETPGLGGLRHVFLGNYLSSHRRRAGAHVWNGSRPSPRIKLLAASFPKCAGGGCARSSRSTFRHG